MINKVTLIGNLGKDAEVQTLETGVAVARFSLATNENYKDKNGEWQKQTEWHSITVWRELAERCKALKKGMLVFVDGKVTYRKYTDKDGVERTVTDIVAHTVRPLEKIEQAQSNEAPPTESNFPTEAPQQPDPTGDLPF